MRLKPLTLLALSMLISAPAGAQVGAGVRNDFPSCRPGFFKEGPDKTSSRDLYIILDRTVSFNDVLQKDALRRIAAAITPGDHLRLISFSGLTQSEFTLVQLDGFVDSAATDEELETKIPASKVGEAKRCFAKQPEIVREKVIGRLRELLQNPLSAAKRSEILKALTVISRESIAEKERAKVVVVLSDMLEYSDIVSFYEHSTLKQIDTKKAMAAAQREQLVGEFARARIYVIGAAAAASESDAQRGLKARRSLETFWTEWIAASNGLLAGWGEPALVQDIR